MNLKGVAYHFIVFGDFQEINATPEVIQNLLELFKESKEVLVPMSIQQTAEVISKTNTSSSKGFLGLVFMNSTRTLSIAFGGTRIDIMRQIDSKDSVENDMIDFHAHVNFLLKRVFAAYNKKCKRMALIQNLITKEVSDEKIQKVFTKIFVLPSDIMNNEKRDWSFRVTNRVPLKFNGREETVNSNVSLSRSLKEPILLEIDSNKFAYIIECNTVPENKETRFGIEDIAEFFNSSTAFLKQQTELFVKHIEL